MCLFLYIDTTTHTYIHTNYKVQLNETSQIILSTIETSVVSHYGHFPLKYNYCPCWCIHVEDQFTSINIVLNYSFIRIMAYLAGPNTTFHFLKGESISQVHSTEFVLLCLFCLLCCYVSHPQNHSMWFVQFSLTGSPLTFTV